MTSWNIFIIRAVLGVVFGLILARVFFPQKSISFIVGLCAMLVALAYVSEFFRKRKKNRRP